MQCLQVCLGSSGFSRAHRTLRALQASQPEKRVRSPRPRFPIAGWEGLKGNESYFGIDACPRGKGREISQQKRLKGGEKGQHWRNDAGSRMWGIESTVGE